MKSKLEIKKAFQKGLEIGRNLFDEGKTPAKYKKYYPIKDLNRDFFMGIREGYNAALIEFEIGKINVPL